MQQLQLKIHNVLTHPSIHSLRCDQADILALRVGYMWHFYKWAIISRTTLYYHVYYGYANFSATSYMKINYDAYNNNFFN